MHKKHRFEVSQSMRTQSNSMRWALPLYENLMVFSYKMINTFCTALFWEDTWFTLFRRFDAIEIDHGSNAELNRRNWALKTIAALRRTWNLKCNPVNGLSVQFYRLFMQFFIRLKSIAIHLHAKICIISLKRLLRKQNKYLAK